MMLLRLISWPYIRKHLLRSILTTAGIVLGVALLVGMQTANQSVLQSFNQTVDRIAGKAQLQVTAGDAGFPEDVLQRVESAPEVRAAAPVIEASVDTGLPGQGKLLILAVDMTGDRSLRDYDFESGDDDVIDDPLVFLAQPDSLILTREFADRNGIRSGGKITFDTMEGPKQFTVRGILKAGGMAAAFGGNLGIMDIYAAEKVFGRGQRFDRIDVGLREDVPVERGQEALQKALGPGFTVEPPSGRARQFQSLLGIYRIAIGISSAFALFIGMFIIYNSFSIAVTQRRSEIGILRALGATRRQIGTLFLGESALAGLIGSACGVGVGLAFARSLTGFTGRMMESIFGVPQNANEVILEPRFLLFAMAMGVAVSMAAAFIPARNAARVEPVQALQKGRYQVLGAGESRVRRVVALGAAAGAVACLAFRSYLLAFYLGYLLAVLAFLLLTPFLALELARVLRVPLKRLKPVEGSLAVDSLIQAPRRTSATVAALMLSLALVIAQGGVSVASFRSIEEWVTTSLNPDLFVTASETIAARDFRFPASMRGELEQIPGVDEAEPVRTARVQFRGSPVMIIAIDVLRLARRVHRIVVAGDPDGMNRLASEEKGVILAETLANLDKLRVGDMVELPTPRGPLRLPVVGVVRDYSNQLGSVIVDRKTYIRYFQDDSADLFRIYLKRGVSAAEVKARIIDSLGKQRRIFVLLNREVRDWVMRLTDQWLGMTYIQVIVAVIVAVLGIINTLTVSIADRRRELGVLRAVGGLRAQIRGAVWMEAAAIGAIGLALGIASGAVMLYYELQVIRRDLTGMPLEYAFPAAMVALLVPVILAAAVGSAILPAETAVRSSLVEALEYE
ncbi:MAG: FtsX-like permease family protein [Acidobacteriia bacterium]|nr:FtsX-like permease family protein [Terriglobia bacterium]